MSAFQRRNLKFYCAVTVLIASVLFLGMPEAKAAKVEPPNRAGDADIHPDKKPDIDDINPVITLPQEIEIEPPSDEDGSTAEENSEDKPAVRGVQEGGGKPLDEAPPPIQRDMSKLPVPVARMRELLMEAARSGRIDDLRQLIGSGQNITVLSLGGIEGDPIEFLKSLSGDDQGHEILAILLEVLEAGYIHMDEGTENELYIWPYFFAWPLDKLSAVQKVELFRIITAGDFEDMKSFGGYIFYRVGITPEGRWQFFVAGD